MCERRLLKCDRAVKQPSREEVGVMVVADGIHQILVLPESRHRNHEDASRLLLVQWFFMKNDKYLENPFSDE